VPDVVVRIAAGRPVRAVWVNEVGGVTFRVGTEFVKTSSQDLATEVERLRWAARYVTVRLAELTTRQQKELDDPPPIDKLVVCHGDACAPNTLIDDAGNCCGHVDLGDLGVADRWADLAVATLSLGWNYPDGPWDAERSAGYGIQPDPARIYRRLWNADDVSSH
jgi:aminoglycoside phosphotransferase